MDTVLLVLSGAFLLACIVCLGRGMIELLDELIEDKENAD